MISILVPTRNRPEALKRSYDSLRSRTTEDFEFLLAVDEDDTTDYSDYDDVWVMPRHGYTKLHLYYNELAEHATGDWLFLWNDDCLMQTDDWTAVIEAFEPKLVLNPASNHGSTLCCFPIVPKRFVDLIGHFSLNCSNDTWWEEIGKMLGILTHVPTLNILHDRADLTGNNNDQVYQERVYDSANFYSMEMKTQREHDAAKLGGLL